MCPSIANNCPKRRSPVTVDAYALLGYTDDESDTTKQSADPMVGNLFADQYEINSVLGEGGMSVVYKARHRLMDRVVAIKLLKGDADELSIARFKLEAKAASSLNHPNIIAVHDFGIYNKEPYLVMDYLEGTDLSARLQNEKRLPLECAVNIFRQTCEGLDHAHRKGIVHRDLKPSNLCLVKEDGFTEQLRIVDFGIAKILALRGAQPTQVTQTGDVFGSPLYMSPEQCLAQPLDTRSDIYSLGCVMYEALTGVPPHDGGAAFNTMTRHVSMVPKSFCQIDPDLRIDKSMEAIVFRCLEKKREDRYQSVSEILADLQSVSPKEGTQSSKKVVLHPSKQRREMKFLRYGFWTLLVLSSALVAYMCLDNGTDHNSGTVLDKTIWNTQIRIAQLLMKAQLYQPAQALLSTVEKTAESKFTERGPLLTAFYLERDLYKKAHMYEELESTNRKITDSVRGKLLSYYDSTTQEVDDLLKYKSEVECNVNKVMAGITLTTIGRTSRALTYNSMEKEAETMLTQAKKVYVALLGTDDVSVAGIDVLLADYYLYQQETRRVRPLLVEAVNIYKNKKGMTDERTILALMKLGQLDRDENNFTASKVELEQALKAAEKVSSADKTVLSRCLRSYADYCDQTRKHNEASMLYAKADALSAQSHSENQLN